MAVRPRGGGFQVDRTVTIAGTKQRIRRDFTTAVEADAFDRALQVSALQQTAIPADTRQNVHTLRAAVTRCIEVNWRGRKSEKTATLNAEAAIKHFGPGTFLGAIDAAAITDYALVLERAGNQNGTVNRKLAALSLVLRQAVEDGKLAAMPSMKKARRKESQGRVTFYTPEEESEHLRLLREWGYDDIADLYIVLVDTGGRLSEVLGLRDWTTKPHLMVIFRDTKNGETRSVPLTTRAHYALVKQGERTPHLWQDLTEWRLRSAWERLRLAVGRESDPEFIIHTLRHTCASRLVQRGRPLIEVKEWMGHKVYAMTLRYAHLAPTQLLNAVAVLDDQSNVVPLVPQAVTRQGAA